MKTVFLSKAAVARMLVLTDNPFLPAVMEKSAKTGRPVQKVAHELRAQNGEQIATGPLAPACQLGCSAAASTPTLIAVADESIEELEENDGEHGVAARAAFDAYLNRIGTFPRMTAKEEIEAGSNIQEHPGTPAAEISREKLICANLLLVVSIAKKYKIRSMLIEDLVLEGNRGLMTAVDRYEPKKKTRFATYAAYWIKNSIMEALHGVPAIRLPDERQSRLAKIQKAPSFRGLGQEQNYDLLSQETELDAATIESCLELPRCIANVDQSCDGNDSDSYHQLPDDHDDAATLFMKNEEKQLALEAMSTCLTTRDEQILKSHFGFGGPPETLKQISQHYGFSQKCIRRIIENAVSQLRACLDQGFGYRVE